MTWKPVDPMIRRGCRKLSVLAPEFLYSENNDIGVPSFILSGAPLRISNDIVSIFEVST